MELLILHEFLKLVQNESRLKQNPCYGRTLCKYNHYQNDKCSNNVTCDCFDADSLCTSTFYKFM